MLSSGSARTASGVSAPSTRARNRPWIVDAAAPASCWNVIDRTSAANGPSGLRGPQLDRAGPLDDRGEHLVACRQFFGGLLPRHAGHDATRRPRRLRVSACRPRRARTASRTARRTGRCGAISSACVPRSTMRPRSSTMISSAALIVDSRWAMTSDARPSCASAKACCTRASVSESRCAVASSRMTMAGFLSSTRAMARRCFSPPDMR